MARFIPNPIIGSLAAFSLIAALALPLGAQSTSIRLEGTVWDLSDEPLPGAILTAVNESTGRQYEAVSDEDGYYKFLALPPGTYTVTAKAKGFKDIILRNIHLTAPGSLAQDFVFEASALDKEIGPEELPRLNDSATTLAVTTRDFEAMPLLNRDPLSLLIYQPGVLINGGNEAASTVNGTRRATHAIGFDALSITDPVHPSMGFSLLPLSPEGISEIQIVTTGAKAEYGRSAGAQFMAVSRSGSKTWSGGLYDYLRHSEFSANDFFNNAQKLSQPRYLRNIYGASASGPFGDKTLLFANYEGTRTDRKVIRNRLVLTEEAKSGLFRWYEPGDTTRNKDTVRSFDIAANDPRGLGIDPAVAAILKKLPESNNNDIGDKLNTAGFRFESPVYERQHRLAVRADHSLHKDHHLFFRFNWNRFRDTDVWDGAEAPYPQGTAGLLRQNHWGFAVGSDWTISPQMINELRIGYLRPETERVRDARLSGPMLLANSWDNPLHPSFPSSHSSPIFEISDNLAHAKGRHALKYGFTFRRTLLSSTDYAGVYPDVTFGLGMGNAPDPSIGPAEQSEISIEDRETFDNLYNDLLGRMESVSQTFHSDLTSFAPGGTPKKRDFAFQEYAAYIQDDWKIRPNLTLNLGLRYEINSAPREKNDLQIALDKAGQISPSANIADFSVVRGGDWYPRSSGDIAPRVGFAWDAYSTGKTLLRGSYGIYYDRFIGAISRFIDNNSYGLTQRASVYPNAAGTDFRLSDGIPTVPQPAPMNLTPPATRSHSIAIFDPNLSTPRVHHFNLTLEKRHWGAVWEIGYVGSRGKKLFQYLNLNQTKTDGDFLKAFKEIQAYRDMGSLVPSDNTLVRLFGSPFAAMSALGGYNLDTGQAGAAADNLDRYHYQTYGAAGVSDYYLRNFPQFDRFIVGSSVGESSYNAVVMGMRTSGRSYQLRMNYTWSTTRDTLSADGDAYVAAPDSLNFKTDKTPSDLDRKHVLNVALNYSFPFTRQPDSDMSWIMGLFADWNISAHYIRESGPRFSVFTDRETLYAGVKSLADFSGSSTAIGKIYNYNKATRWFNEDQIAQFTYPAAGEIGNTGRNAFIGQPYSNLDVALFKNFYVAEKHRLHFRIEAYNLFNQTHFALPNADLSSDDFGKITSTVGTPRVLQFGLRYQF